MVRTIVMSKMMAVAVIGPWGIAVTEVKPWVRPVDDARGRVVSVGIFTDLFDCFADELSVFPDSLCHLATIRLLIQTIRNGLNLSLIHI